MWDESFEIGLPREEISQVLLKHIPFIATAITKKVSPFLLMLGTELALKDAILPSKQNEYLLDF